MRGSAHRLRSATTSQASLLASKRTGILNLVVEVGCLYPLKSLAKAVQGSDLILGGVASMDGGLNEGDGNVQILLLKTVDLLLG